MALDGEFKVYLPRLLPLLLQVFETDDSEKRLPTLEVLTALKKFGATLEEYLHLVIPVIVRLFERPDVPLALRKVLSSFFFKKLFANFIHFIFSNNKTTTTTSECHPNRRPALQED